MCFLQTDVHMCPQTCQVCRKGDDDEYLLLCDGCDRGCHMFCLRPKVMQVPEGDWFCPTCVAKVCKIWNIQLFFFFFNLIHIVILKNLCFYIEFCVRIFLPLPMFMRNKILQENGDTPRSQRSSRQRSKARKRRLAEDSSDEDDGYKRGMTTRQKDTTASSSGTSISPSKRRRMTTRNQPDLTYCEWVFRSWKNNIFKINQEGHFKNMT